MDLHIYGSRSKPEASLCVEGKPEEAGGPVMNTLQYTWKSVHVGGHTVGLWGNPTLQEAHRVDLHMQGSQSKLEAPWCVHGKPDKAGGPVMNALQKNIGVSSCRRPYCRHLGSLTLQEAHRKDQHMYGSRCKPEASWVQGKPDKEGGPVMQTP